MKKTSVIMCVFYMVCSFTANIYSADLQFVPSESLGFVRLSNIGKTIDTIIKNAQKIDSSKVKKNVTSQTYPGIMLDEIKDKKKLEDSLGVNLEGDVILFWPDSNWKTMVTAYSIVDKEKCLNNIKASKGDPIQPAPVHEGVEIYTFKKKNTRRECFFFIDGYQIKCNKESTARLIINCFKGKDKSINTNEKYINFKQSVRENELIIFIDLEKLTQPFLPMIQMLTEGYTKKITADPKMQQKLKDQKIDPQKIQKIKNLYVKATIWCLEQFDDMGFSIGLDEESLIVDSYIGFKKESKIQDYLINKKENLEHMKYVSGDVIYTVDAKSNPEAILDIFNEIFENYDSTVISTDSTNIKSWKEFILEDLKDQTLYLGYEKSMIIMLSEESFPIQWLEIEDVKDAKMAQKAAQEYGKIDVMIMNILKNVIPIKTFQDSEYIMKVEEVIDYNKVKITSMKYNTTLLSKYNKDIPWDMNNYILHHAIVKDKQIVTISVSDRLIKQTIDSMQQGKTKPMLTDSISYKTAIKGLPENTDSVSYLSVVSLLKVINRFAVLFKPKICFDVMKKIETASAEYFNTTETYPQKMDDMYARGLLKRSLLKKTGDRYILDKNTGKVTCTTHGSMNKPVPLENVDDKFIKTLSVWENKIDGIGFSSKNQNYGISGSINIPIEVIKSSIAMKKQLKNKKKRKEGKQKIDKDPPKPKNIKDKKPLKIKKGE